MDGGWRMEPAGISIYSIRAREREREERGEGGVALVTTRALRLACSCCNILRYSFGDCGATRKGNANCQLPMGSIHIESRVGSTLCGRWDFCGSRCSLHLNMRISSTLQKGQTESLLRTVFGVKESRAGSKAEIERERTQSAHAGGRAFASSSFLVLGDQHKLGYEL